jgi:hypothetical protein
MKTRQRATHRFNVLFLLVLALSALSVSEGVAGEFRFIAGQVADNRAIWEPSVTLIDQETDLKGGVVFGVENPTNLEHVFAVRGLHEIVPEKAAEQVDIGVVVETMAYTLKPIHVKVGPKETKRIQVYTEPLQGPYAVGNHFKVFCTIHKDVHIGSAIYVAR